MVLAKVGRIPCQTLCGYFMALEGKRISELTEVSRVNNSSKLPIDTGGEEALSITLENLMESGVNAAIEALQFITWVDVLPPTGSTKYLYAVPREEVDKDGHKIAALYLWDGTECRGAGAFSLNIDPDTLATKTEVANNYLPKKNPIASGMLSVQPVLELRNTENGNWIKFTMSDVVYVGGEGQKNDIAFGEGFVLRRRLNGAYTDKVLWTSDKAVAYGVASLDENAKIPENQLPDVVSYQAILREW